MSKKVTRGEQGKRDESDVNFFAREPPNRRVGYPYRVGVLKGRTDRVKEKEGRLVTEKIKSLRCNMCKGKFSMSVKVCYQ